MDSSELFYYRVTRAAWFAAGSPHDNDAFEVYRTALVLIVNNAQK
jgi:hypothetical protein